MDHEDEDGGQSMVVGQLHQMGDNQTAEVNGDVHFADIVHPGSTMETLENTPRPDWWPHSQTEEEAKQKLEEAICPYLG